MTEIWPVCKGEPFSIWEPDTGKYFDSVDAECLKSHLHDKRLRQSRTSSSAFSELSSAVNCDPSTLPCLRPRIVFRDVTRATDTRTMVASLIPGNRVTTHKAPHLLEFAGTAIDEAFMLGVLSPMPFDWQVRRMVELHVTFGQLNRLSIPDSRPRDPIRTRVVEIAAWLASCDRRLAGWARQACSEIAADAPLTTPAPGTVGGTGCLRRLALRAHGMQTEGSIRHVRAAGPMGRSP